MLMYGDYKYGNVTQKWAGTILDKTVKSFTMFGIGATADVSIDGAATKPLTVTAHELRYEGRYYPYGSRDTKPVKGVVSRLEAASLFETHNTNMALYGTY
jgi:hypothetical protein